METWATVELSVNQLDSIEEVASRAFRHHFNFFSTFCALTIMDGSPFSKISAELRNRIWEYTLISDTPVVVTSDTVCEYVRTPFNHATALLQVCKQTRQECTSMFYHNNTFQMEANIFSNSHERNGAEVKVCSMFLDTIGRDNSSEVRNIDMLVRRLSGFDEQPVHYFDQISGDLGEMSILVEDLKLDKMRCIMCFEQAWLTGTVEDLVIDILSLKDSVREAIGYLETRVGGEAHALTRIIAELRFVQAWLS